MSTHQIGLHYNIEITKENFQEIFNIMYDILKLKIDDKVFEIISRHYLKLLMNDASDGYNVDINWFIDHVWYLCIGISSEVETKIYRDCIPYIQQSLIKKFNIEESINQKVSRKVYTRLMVKC